MNDGGWRQLSYLTALQSHINEPSVWLSFYFCRYTNTKKNKKRKKFQQTTQKNPYQTYLTAMDCERHK